MFLYYYYLPRYTQKGFHLKCTTHSIPSMSAHRSTSCCCLPHSVFERKHLRYKCFLWPTQKDWRDNYVSNNETVWCNHRIKIWSKIDRIPYENSFLRRPAANFSSRHFHLFKSNVLICDVVAVVMFEFSLPQRTSLKMSITTSRFCGSWQMKPKIYTTVKSKFYVVWQWGKGEYEPHFG